MPNNMQPIKKFYAFTLIELIIAIALFAIVLAFAVPSFYSILQNNRTINLTNDLISSLNLARTEAIKRGSSVSVCATNDQNFNSCGNDWNQGWLIFVNPDENNIFANDTVEPLVRVQQIDIGSADITLTPANIVITYTSSGFVSSASRNAVFSIKTDGCTGNYARRISISASGRPVTTEQSC